MPQYKAPGVYVEEVERGAKPIEGVGTSTAGFLGETERGPETPRLLTSYADYRRHFGGVVEGRYLAQAVNGFFQNGGSRCYVGRVTAENTATAEGHLPPLGATAGRLRATRRVLDFGRVPNDETPTRTVEVEALEATGDETITITGLEVTGTLRDDFEVVTDVPDGGIPVEAGEPEDIEVRFVHGSTESSSTDPVLEMTVAGEATADEVTLTGEALADDLGAPGNDGELGLSTRRLDFGTVAVGETAEMAVTVRNLGSTDITLADPALSLGSGTHFTIGSPGDYNNTTLGSGETTDVTITAEPTAEGEQTDGLTVELSGGNTWSIDLVVDAVLTDEVLSAEAGDSARDGQLAVPTGSLDFGSVVGGTSRTRTLTLYNRGTVEVTLTGVSTTPDAETFSLEEEDAITNDDPADNPVIAGGSSTDLTVRAHPDREDSGDTSVTLTLDYEYTDSTGTDQTGQIRVTVEADVAESIIELSAVGPGDWGTGVAVTVADGSLYKPDENDLFQVTVRYWSDPADRAAAKPVLADPDADIDEAPAPDVEEVYDNLTTDEASSDYYGKTLDGSSTLVEVDESSKTDTRPANGTFWLDGTFPNEDVTAGDYEGDPTADPADRTGFAAFEGIDEISIVCIPDENEYGTPLAETIVNHCTTQKDRFAILQSRRQADRPGPLEPSYRSDFAAFYYPWLTVGHPETERDQQVPPGGHVAGIYARSDQEHGVHKAPANEQVRGIRGLQKEISKGDQEILNPRGVNCIRTFRGRGTRVWGARTTSSDPAWKYVNVRRLFLFVEESIDEGTQWVVFEPNDEQLWARVRQTIRNFLTSVWQDGALMGTTPEEAFFVKCDRSTMTQNDIDNGRLICEIGIAPVKPAEFVVFRIAQTTAGAEG